MLHSQQSPADHAFPLDDSSSTCGFNMSACSDVARQGYIGLEYKSGKVCDEAGPKNVILADSKVLIHSMAHTQNCLMRRTNFVRNTSTKPV
jgi:hypothetical protein